MKFCKVIGISLLSAAVLTGCFSKSFEDGEKAFSESDFQSAKEIWIDVANKQSDDNSMYGLYRIYLRHPEVVPYEEAIGWLQRAADAGRPDAEYEYGIFLAELLAAMQVEMLERARAHRDSHTYAAKNYEEFKKIFAEKSGFVKAMWCGDRACEDKIKEDLSVTSRCMPFEQEQIADTCVCCGKPATKMVYWGRAY